MVSEDSIPWLGHVARGWGSGRQYNNGHVEDIIILDCGRQQNTGDVEDSIILGMLKRAEYWGCVRQHNTWDVENSIILGMWEIAECWGCGLSQPWHTHTPRVQRPREETTASLVDKQRVTERAVQSYGQTDCD